MKKLILIFAVISNIFIISSCKKTESINDELKNNTVNSSRLSDIDVEKTSYGFLKFKDYETYELYLSDLANYSDEELDNWESSLEFTSLRTAKIEGTESTESLNRNLEDKLLQTIINPLGLIQIGENVFKSETDQGLCWTLKEADLETDYDNLISRNFVAEKMNRINDANDADVFELLELGTVGIYEERTKGIFGTDHKPAPVDVTVEFLSNRGDAKASYQAAVFYFSLYTELKTYKKAVSAIVWTPLSTNICLTNSTFGDSWCQYKKKGASMTGVIYKNTCNNGFHHDWRPYSGGKKLEKFKIEGHFSFFCPVDGLTHTHNAGVFNF